LTITKLIIKLHIGHMCISVSNETSSFFWWQWDGHNCNCIQILEVILEVWEYMYVWTMWIITAHYIYFTLVLFMTMNVENIYYLAVTKFWNVHVYRVHR